MASGDVVLLLVALIGLSATVLIVLYFAGYFRGSPRRVADTATEEQDAAVNAGGRRAAGAGGLAALRRRKDKKKKDSDRDAATDQPAQRQPPVEDNDAVLQDVDGADHEDGLVEPRALTKKELAKEMKKREREEMRRFEEQRREELKKKNEAKEEALQKKREEDAKLEQAKEEEALRLKEEKVKQEQEEFDKWKNMFVVEEEGSRLAEDSEESQNLLQQFVDYIKSHKVVLLEDLAVEFNMATQDAIQRVEALQEANRITGIIDDRGKFIYITDEEMEKVAKYIQRKGRMALSELSKECNKLIRLEGEHVSDATLTVDWLNEDAPADQQQEGKEASA
uniref:DDRGK domain-containing protein 1 n=1 Tax=Globisporangium ultimum (strain ATCC 200006 / CBS 805.95 / DAOM BR144) TaxID=431595 RepID=K3W7P3_GLOUD